MHLFAQLELRRIQNTRPNP